MSLSVRRRLARIVAALVLSSLGLLAPLAVSASNAPIVKVNVPAKHQVTTVQHPCADDKARLCKLERILNVPAHIELREKTTAGVTNAHACDGPWNLGYVSYSENDYNYYGVEVTSATVAGSPWYTGCTSGWYWVSGSCWNGPGYYCDSESHGSFWDGGLGASTAWANVQTGCCWNLQTVWWYPRMDMYPSGYLASRSG